MQNSIHFEQINAGPMIEYTMSCPGENRYFGALTAVLIAVFL